MHYEIFPIQIQQIFFLMLNIQIFNDMIVIAHLLNPYIQ